MNPSPERSLRNALDALPPDIKLRGSTVLAAVSGGSDSLAMLCLLREAAQEFGFSLMVCTVSHMIRDRAESDGDALFVRDFCSRFEPPVACRVVELAEGEVARLAVTRGKGIEEAARHLRYGHLEAIAREVGGCLVCTGHTRNDQLETVLMRFLQGAGGSSLGGIARLRGIFFRPVLDCSREDLAGWLSARGISWREDSTNADVNYLRNRIRHTLVPTLNSGFPGWESGVLSAAARSALDENLCRSLLGATWRHEDKTGALECDASVFAALHPALRHRFLKDGFVLLGVSHRVPSGFIERLARAPEDWPPDGDFLVSGSSLSLKKTGNLLFLSLDIVHTTKSGYLVSTCAPGIFTLPWGDVAVSEREGGVFLDGRFGPFEFPLTIRSRMPGDAVLMADGRQKTLKKLMGDWSVAPEDRDLIPVVEQDSRIRAVYGGALGYPDWYVHAWG